MHSEHPESQLYGQVRSGRVSSVDKKRHTVQVEFQEIDGFISWDLNVLVTRPGDYSLPAKDTPVLCLIVDGRLGVGYVLGAIYTDSDAPPLDDDEKRSIVGDDIRLGTSDASDKIALAPATKSEIQKAVDYAEGIALAIQAGVPASPSFDGGTALKNTIVAALPIKPTINEPKAEKVSAK